MASSKLSKRKKSDGERRVASATADRGFTAETAEEVTTSAIPVSLQAGQFVRWTITVRPERWERAKQIAEELSVEVSDRTGAPAKVPLLTLARWLIDQGIAAYERGERPLFETQLRLK